MRPAASIDQRRPEAPSKGLQLPPIGSPCHNPGMSYRFNTRDHPEANNRQPIAGELAFNAIFPIENGGELVVGMGREGYIRHVATMLAMLEDDPEMLAEVAAISRELREGH
jgi:hypothetical protein